MPIAFMSWLNEERLSRCAMMLLAACLLLCAARDAVAENNLVGVATASLPYPAGKAPRFWSVATAETIMARYPDYREAYFKPWTYVHGYVLYGFEMLYNATGDKKYFDYIKRYIDSIVDVDGNFYYTDRKTGKRAAVKFNNLDNMMTGNLVVMLYEQTKEEKYRKAAERIRRALDDYPRNSDGGFWHGASMTGQMWIDGVFMGQMFLTRYGKSIGDSQYCWDEATRQITVFARRALKGDTGLYYHGWSESPATTKWANKETGLSCDVWSEGLGWYALIVAETLAALPQDHPKRAEVEGIFKRLAAGLKRVQDPKSGRWFQVVDKTDRPENWTDNSGSAMFTYALARGIELGLLDGKEYGPMVRRGYQGILQNAKINERGLVDIESACDGVGVQVDYDHYINYKKTTNAKEAVGGFLWATAIVEKTELEKTEFEKLRK